jgi:hypothetical protein
MDLETYIRTHRKAKDRLQELLTTEIDELAVSLVGVSDPAQEPVRLARLMSQL